MTDAYDELRKDWCDVGDLPRATCHHCGAHPGGPALPPLERPWTFDGQRVTRRSGRDVFPSAPTPKAKPRPLASGSREGGCTCGRPTRDNAYGCDDCADELSRMIGDVPWLAEQLETTIVRIVAKWPESGGRSPDAVIWHEKAARIQKRLRRLLATTVKLCVDTRVRHSSPDLGLPERTPAALSRWLLWRVDGLTFRPEFPEILREALAIEIDTLWVIDRAPDLMFLGKCKADGGAIYAKRGNHEGRCRVCNASYPVEERKTELQRELDDRLLTAAEIAKCAVYLGIHAKRDTVANLVRQWHKRKLIAAAPGGGEPRFRYGDVAPRLARAYPNDSKGA